MHDSEKRRIEDSGFWKIVRMYPLLGGIGMALISLGGYIATIHYIGDHLNKIDSWIISQEKANSERNTIMERLVTLQEVTNKRLDQLEDWERNGK